jgi:hypothetical protein
MRFSYRRRRTHFSKRSTNYKSHWQDVKQLNLMKESNLTTKNNQKQELKERKSKKNIKEQAKDSGI